MVAFLRRRKTRFLAEFHANCDFCVLHVLGGSRADFTLQYYETTTPGPGVTALTYYAKSDVLVMIWARASELGNLITAGLPVLLAHCALHLLANLERSSRVRARLGRKSDCKIPPTDSSPDQCMVHRHPVESSRASCTFSAERPAHMPVWQLTHVSPPRLILLHYTCEDKNFQDVCNEPEVCPFYEYYYIA